MDHLAAAINRLNNLREGLHASLSKVNESVKHARNDDQRTGSSVLAESLQITLSSVNAALADLIMYKSKTERGVDDKESHLDT